MGFLKRLPLLLIFARLAFADEPAYLWTVVTPGDFETLSVPDNSRPDILRVTKYMTPAGDPAGLLPSVYQNVNLEPFHFLFLRTNFPEFFAGLTMQEYLAMIQRRETRTYYSGALWSFEDPVWGTLYGFNVITDQTDPGQLLTQQETRALYLRISETFLLRPFAYAPYDFRAIQAARSWSSPDFPIYYSSGLENLEFEGYSRGVNYGRIRIMTIQEFERIGRQGLISWQDILVLDQPPADIESVVAGVITGDRQGELSHINVRCLARGTPNAFVRNAHEIFDPLDGQLVRLSVEENRYQVRIAPLDEAESWWEANRPSLPNLLPADPSYTGLDLLAEIPDLHDATQAAGRFGAKAANLAALSEILPATHQVEGFGIPMHYYREFLRTNRVWDSIHAPRGYVTYEEYLERLMRNPEFRGDSVTRRLRLAALQAHMRKYGEVPPGLVDEIVLKSSLAFENHWVKLRFRSSSNVEDSLEFSAAGLYDSRSGCIADEMDENPEGPSHCDPTNRKQRVSDAVRAVWASLWNFRAFEEREYYRIPHMSAMMGILVSRAFPDEGANGVIFTGDPITGSRNYYVVNVQHGGTSVVQPDPGVVPEKDLLVLEGGQVIQVIRVRGSSLLPEGEWVLTEDQLILLGNAMANVEEHFPVDAGEYPREKILLDAEFKFEWDGRMFIKQVRPFLVR